MTAVAPDAATADALACLRRVAQTHPGAVTLARYASLATRVDAALLRRLRLAMAPGLDAGAEADLWFSDLAESRDGVSMVLDPAIASVLRAQLAAERLPDGASALDQAAAHTRAMHAGWPASLQLEEALHVLALRAGATAGADVEADVDGLLRPAIAAMAGPPQRAVEIARWAVRALPNLPPVVRHSAAARTLLLASIALLGADDALVGSVAPGDLPPDLGWLLPDQARQPRVRLRCDLHTLPADAPGGPAGPGAPGAGATGSAGTALLVFQPAGPQDVDALCVDLPQTQPLLVALAIQVAGQPPPGLRLTTLVPGVPLTLPPDWAAVALRGLDGRGWAIDRPAPSPPPPARPPAPPPPPPSSTYLGQDFKTDIFFSTWHAAGDANDRWADRLADQLRRSLRDLVGDVHIWRDFAVLQDGDSWQSEVDDTIRHAGLFLAVVSPGYLDSERCRRELALFQSDERRGELARGLRRVVVVVRQRLSPTHLATLESLAPGLAHHVLFDAQDARGGELDPQADDGAAYQRYQEQVGPILYDLMDGLEAIWSAQRAIATAHVPAVYLADCGADVLQQREWLHAALREQGCRVLRATAGQAPDGGWQAAVQAHLAEAVLSVHLVGASAESVSRDADGRPVDAAQLAWAEQQGRSTGLRRLVWATGGAQADPVQQRLHDAALDSANDGLCEVFQGPFTQFEEAVLDQWQAARRAAALNPPPPPPAPA